MLKPQGNGISKSKAQELIDSKALTLEGDYTADIATAKAEAIAAAEADADAGDAVVTSAISTAISNIPDASTSVKGLALLSNLYNGTSEALAVTEKALKDGLASVTAQILKYKSSDEVVDNSATLQNDDDLYFSVGANEVWYFRLVLRLVDTGGAEFRINFSVPTGGDVHYSRSGERGADCATVIDFVVVKTLADGDQKLTSRNDQCANIIEGFYIGGANAGTLQFQWAQYTADGEGITSTIRKGSCLIANKVS